MRAVTPVLLLDHTGVERELRFTPGARRRIAEHFGTENMVQVAQDKGDWALYVCAYYMMYDSKGNAPAEYSLEEWMENCSGSEGAELVAALMASVTQGKTSKKEVEEMLEKMEGQTGLTSGPTVASVSDSQTQSSGGDTPTLS